MAEQKPYLTGRTYIFRITKGKDLMEALGDFCHDNQIKCGIINGIGLLENATVCSYDIVKKKYDKRVRNKPVEMANLTGNVSIMDNRANIRADVILVNGEGKTEAGQLSAGTKVFTAEIFIQELVGEPKVRKQDKITKLNLWI